MKTPEDNLDHQHEDQLRHHHQQTKTSTINKTIYTNRTSLTRPPPLPPPHSQKETNNPEECTIYTNRMSLPDPPPTKKKETIKSEDGQSPQTERHCPPPRLEGNTGKQGHRRENKERRHTIKGGLL